MTEIVFLMKQREIGIDKGAVIERVAMMFFIGSLMHHLSFPAKIQLLFKSHIQRWWCCSLWITCIVRLLCQ